MLVMDMVMVMVMDMKDIIMAATITMVDIIIIMTVTTITGGRGIISFSLNLKSDCAIL
jgi:hypothetical protein